MKTLQLKILADGFVFLEGPRWRDGRLWVSDMFSKAVYTLTPDGARSKIVDVPNRPSGIGFRPLPTAEGR